MTTLLLLVICLVGLGVFCSALLVLVMVYEYLVYKYPIVEEDDDLMECDYDEYWL